MRREQISRHPSLWTVLLVGVVGLLSCSNQQDGMPEITRSRDADVPSVTVHSFARDRLPEPWHLDTLLTVGSAAGDEKYLLHHPGWIVVDRDRNLFVGDWGNYRIQEYDPGGRWLTTIGRQGSGPGELRTEMPQLGGLALWTEDRLAVTDQRQGRLHIYTTSGVFIRTYYLKSPNVVGPVYEMSPHRAVLKTDRYLDASRILIVDQTEFACVDTLFQVPLNPWQHLPSAGQVYSPYYPRLIWTQAPSGEVVIGQGYPYRLDWLDPSGSRIRTLIVDWLDAPVTAEEEAAIRENIRTSRYGTPDLAARMAREIRIPSMKPAFQRIFIDDVERVWIEHAAVPYDENSTDDVYGYDVFAKDLVPLGKLSSGFRIETVFQGRVYGISRGSEGEDVVLVCRLVARQEH
jgi:hypothetical protein